MNFLVLLVNYIPSARKLSSFPIPFSLVFEVNEVEDKLEDIKKRKRMSEKERWKSREQGNRMRMTEVERGNGVEKRRSYE